MADNERDNGAERERRAVEAVGRKLRDVLIEAGLLGRDEERPPDDLWELGRLMRAFVRVDDAGVRGEVIALVEAIGLPAGNGNGRPRR